MRKIFTSVIACVLGLVCMGGLSAQNGADVLIDYGPCKPIIPLVCPSGVSNPGNATDNDLSTYATMKTELGLLSSSYLHVGFSNPAPQGSFVAFFVEGTAVLNIDVLGALSMRLYNSDDELILEKVGFSLLEIEIDQDGRGILKLKVPKGESASSARLDAGGLLALSSELDVYGAVHAPSTPPVTADYIYAAGPCNPVMAGCNSGVVNANAAIDPNKANFAGLVIPLGITDIAYFDFGFSDPAPAGSTITFSLGTNGTILGLALLQKLRVTAYDAAGNVIRSKKGFTLAEVELTGTYQFKIKFKTPVAGGEIARARISMSSLVGVLSEVLVYNVSYTPKINFADYFRTASQIAGNDLMIYPNPASSTIHFDYNAPISDAANISIYTIEGKLVVNKLFDKNEIDITNINNGLYLLSIQDNNTTTTKTFTVQR